MGLAVLSLISLFLKSRSSSESSLQVESGRALVPSSKESQFIRPENSLQKEIVKVISSRNWQKVQVYLNDHSTEEMSLTQVLRYVEKETLNSEDQEQLFNLIFSYSLKNQLSPRNRVLAFRIFSHFNLTLDQQKKVRDYFKSEANERFKEDLLYHSYVSSIPFPADFQKKMISDFKSHKNPSICVEHLYILGSMKDLKAKEKLNLNILGLFHKVHKSCQPALAKYLMNNSSDHLKSLKSYQKIVRFMASEGQEGHEK